MLELAHRRRDLLNCCPWLIWLGDLVMGCRLERTDLTALVVRLVHNTSSPLLMGSGCRTEAYSVCLWDIHDRQKALRKARLGRHRGVAWRVFVREGWYGRTALLMGPRKSCSSGSKAVVVAVAVAVEGVVVYGNSRSAP